MTAATPGRFVTCCGSGLEVSDVVLSLSVKKAYPGTFGVAIGMKVIMQVPMLLLVQAQVEELLICGVLPAAAARVCS